MLQITGVFKVSRVKQGEWMGKPQTQFVAENIESGDEFHMSTVDGFSMPNLQGGHYKGSFSVRCRVYRFATALDVTAASLAPVKVSYS